MDPRSRAGLPNLSVEDEGAEETNLIKPLPADTNTVLRVRDQPYLVVVGGALRRQIFAIDGEVKIGRSSTCEIRLNDKGVSREHARITNEGTEYFVEDLDSANGTYLNAQRISGRYRLTPGDRLRIGNSALLRFEWPSEFEDEETATATTSRRALLPEPWDPMSWKTKPQPHVPKYEDPDALRKAVAELARLPPLVTSWEVERLKALIAEAQIGERFLLQGGDCAETLVDCQPSVITNKLKILLQMSLILTHAAHKPVIRVGRFAGQYAKPRSKPTETRDGVELPSYLGDLVNRPAFTPEARRPDPRLLLAGYYHASLTLNFIRALCAGGFSDLRRPEYFDLTIFERNHLDPHLQAEYVRMSKQISEGLHFLRAMGDGALDDLARVEFFASHEGLNLDYESAQTRQVPRRDGWYCMTTHLPWIGERTRGLDGAHVEFFRGVANPIAVKIGPNATPREVVELVRTLNPHDEPGKMVLIVRMGAGNVPVKLPPIIDAVRRTRRRVLWVTDPMHGNGIVTKSGIKTRDFGAILQEIEETFDTHEKCGSLLGGAHFELTGEDVTECIGAGVDEKDLDLRYLTACDPRLNYRQAIEMAFLIAGRMRKANGGTSRSSRPPPSRL